MSSNWQKNFANALVRHQHIPLYRPTTMMTQKCVVSSGRVKPPPNPYQRDQAEVLLQDHLSGGYSGYLFGKVLELFHQGVSLRAGVSGISAPLHSYKFSSINESTVMTYTISSADSACNEESSNHDSLNYGQMWNGEKAYDNEESINDENCEGGVEKGMSNHKSNGTDDANVFRLSNRF